MRKIWFKTVICSLLAAVTLLGQAVPCAAETILADGVYPVMVESSSSMFRVVDAELTVTEGKMSAVLTLSGQGYLKLFMGTSEEAAAAPEEAYIPFVVNEEGAYTYEIPVKAVEEPFDCAAFSKRKEKWYDRTLVIHLEETPLEYAETELADGSYQADVLLSGGSGRASVKTPAEIIIEDGKATAVIEWSSPNYAYMKIGNEMFYPVNTEGNSTFHIPVTAWDEEIRVIGNTTAMSTPHDVEYTLKFVSASVSQQGVSEGGILVAAVLVAAGVGIFMMRGKKKKK